MSDGDRDLVVEYLTAIGLHLDIRARGKRDPGQKLFSSSQCDEFVLGVAHFSKSKSPGLVKNVYAILDIIFDKQTVAEALEDASEPATAAKKPTTARKDRLSASVVGGYGC